MRVDDFIVYVVAICKFKKLYSDIWGGRGMMDGSSVGVLCLMLKMFRRRWARHLRQGRKQVHGSS